MSTQKITIEPVTRIEGHAKITIHLDDGGEVERAYLHINEFRGFEKFCEGRLAFEMPSITPRICGICPVSHHLAAAKAADALAGSPPPRPASLLRELMHMGQIIQSHGMHFYELAGPDLLLGFRRRPCQPQRGRADRGQPGADLEGGQPAQIRSGDHPHPGRAAHPPQFRRTGRREQSPDPGRARADPGGRRRCDCHHPDRASRFSKIGPAHTMEDIQKFAVFSSGYLGLVTPQDSLELYDGDIRLIDRDGDPLERFAGADYLDYIAEHVENWTYLKFPYYKKMGYPGGVYRVGPLGRLNASKQIDTPLANAELQHFKALNGGKPVENTLYYHYARLIEVLFAIEKVRLLLDDPDILSTDILNTRKDWQGVGVGVLEAPRGTLFHHYWADENGRLSKVNLIVATGHNNWAMCTAVDSVAKTYIHAGEIREGLLNRVEAAVRAHDPCLSCSTHAIGQTPLVMDILNSNGELVRRLQQG